MPQSLTDRETEIMTLVASGRTDAEVAACLGVSPKTANFHMENVKRKLGSTTRIHAVALALRDGLVPFPDGGGSA
jgi:DNA-binding CsgD family transcriptional regulator